MVSGLRYRKAKVRIGRLSSRLAITIYSKRMQQAAPFNNALGANTVAQLFFIVITISLMTISQAEEVVPECNFEYWRNIFIESEAPRDAIKNYYEQDYRFYAVADGIAASTYGKEIKFPPEQWCAEFSLETSILWVGADYAQCKDHSELHAAAKKYVLAYNVEMSKQLNKYGIPISCFKKEDAPNTYMPVACQQPKNSNKGYFL